MDVRQLGLSNNELEALGYRVSRPNEAGEPPSKTASPSHRREGSGVRAWLWTLAILVAVGWIAHPNHRMPAPVPANQPDTVFSSARAMSQLVDIARAPRPVGSPEHERVRGFLAERFVALGLEVEIQEHTATVSEGGSVLVAPVRNVLGRLAGVGSTGTVLVAAHYDGAPLSRGAGDNGIGLAAILETARVLEAGGSLRNDVVFLLSDAKELGSLGTESFLAQHPWAQDVRAALILDATGVSGPVVWWNGRAGPTPVTGIAMDNVGNAASYSIVEPLATGGAFSTELTAVHQRGIPGLGLLVLGGRAAHDQPLDRPINVSEATLQHAGSQLLDLTRALGEDDLRTPGDDTADDGYASLPLGLVVHYPTAWGSLANIGLILTFVLLVVLVRLRGGRWSGVLVGLSVGFAVVGLGGAAGYLMTRVAGALHPEMGALDGSVYQSGALFVAIGALVFAVLTAVYPLARRWYVRPEIVVGALTVPLAGVLTMTFLGPGAMVVVQPPLALTLFASIVLILAPTKSTVRFGRVGAVLAGAGVLLFIIPGLVVAAESMTMIRAPVVGALIGFGSLLLLPVVEWLGRPAPWAAPAVGIVVAAAAIGVSTPRFTDGARHPLPSSLALLVEDTMTADRGIAMTSTAALRVDSVPSAATGEVGSLPPAAVPTSDEKSAPGRWMPSRWITVPGVGEAWARSWVVDPTGSGDDPGPLLLPQAERWVVAGAGPDALLPRPEVAVERSAVGTGSHAFEVTIQSVLGAEMVAVILPDDAPAVITEAGGHALGGTLDATPIRAVRFWGRPDDGLLRLTIRGDQRGADGSPPLVLDVVEHHLRPREILGESFFQRADSVMADASTGSDRLVQRVQVRLPRP